MTAHPALIEWPEDPSDEAGLALWTSDEIARATGGRASTSFAVSGVEIDSRAVVEGDLFVALKGEASDGHRYLEGAYGRGAAGTVTVREACAVSRANLKTSRRIQRNSWREGRVAETGLLQALYSAGRLATFGPCWRGGLVWVACQCGGRARAGDAISMI